MKFGKDDNEENTQQASDGLSAEDIDDATVADDDGSGLVLDELDETFDAFLTLRKSDGEAAAALLSTIGASSEVDGDIILEIASKRPLGHPERFESAHTTVMRALEVLDRNGDRGINFSSLGFIGPVAQFLVQLVTRFIIRSHVGSVIDNLRKLYARREAATLIDDPDRQMIVRARVQAERLREGYKRNPLALPTFLLGGAVLSTVINVIVGAVSAAVTNWITRVIFIGVLFLLLAVAAWVILQGAGIASRRIQLSLESPLKALYETIGRCGNPPKDQSRVFAVIALIVAIVAVLIIPIGAGIGWLIDQL